MSKNLVCWYCRIHGYNILDEFDCCKRCGTNLKRWPIRKSHPYPDEIKREFGDEKLSAEVLGTRQKFVIPPEFDEYQDLNPPIKINPLQFVIHWTDENGNKKQKFVDPICSKCGKIATHVLTKVKKNGTKVYRCNECYDKNLEWEEIQ